MVYVFYSMLIFFYFKLFKLILWMLFIDNIDWINKLVENGVLNIVYSFNFSNTRNIAKKCLIFITEKCWCIRMDFKDWSKLKDQSERRKIDDIIIKIMRISFISNEVNNLRPLEMKVHQWKNFKVSNLAVIQKFIDIIWFYLQQNLISFFEVIQINLSANWWWTFIKISNIDVMCPLLRHR